MPSGSKQRKKPPSLQERRWASLGRLLGFAWGFFDRAVVEGVRARGFPDFLPPMATFTRSMDLAGTRVCVIAERAGVTKQSTSELVRLMVGAGYVRLAPDPSDGRAKLVRYTRRGRRLAQAIVATAEQLEKECRTALGAGRTDELKALLQALLDRRFPEHAGYWTRASESKTEKRGKR